MSVYPACTVCEGVTAYPDLRCEVCNGYTCLTHRVERLEIGCCEVQIYCATCWQVGQTFYESMLQLQKQYNEGLDAIEAEWRTAVGAKKAKAS